MHPFPNSPTATLALYPVLRYQQKSEVIKPMKPSTVGQATKGFELVERLQRAIRRTVR